MRSFPFPHQWFFCVFWKFSLHFHWKKEWFDCQIWIYFPKLSTANQLTYLPFKSYFSSRRNVTRSTISMSWFSWTFFGRWPIFRMWQRWQDSFLASFGTIFTFGQGRIFCQRYFQDLSFELHFFRFGGRDLINEAFILFGATSRRSRLFQGRFQLVVWIINYYGNRRSEIRCCGLIFTCWGQNASSRRTHW